MVWANWVCIAYREYSRLSWSLRFKAIFIDSSPLAMRLAIDLAYAGSPPNWRSKCCVTQPLIANANTTSTKVINTTQIKEVL